MTELPALVVDQGGKALKFHGSWYRGDNINFIPTKAALAAPGGLEEYILQGWLPPSPFITRDTAITSFGSCFAHHVTDYLLQHGFNVQGRDLGLQAHIVRFGEGMVNTFAIRQQIEWGLGVREFPERLWFGPNKEIASLDPEVRDVTRSMIEKTEVFIITLGLSEIWYDKVSGEAFWRAIPAEMFDPERHGFRLSTVHENKSNLKEIIRLISSARPNAKIIFTLSPVPLLATFRPVSCLTASSVSKAVLRVAIDEVVRSAGDNVFYFP
ncbi:MAG TPA: GSCFA domain-containing protein, partial [Caulobacteraceae bacterium]